MTKILVSVDDRLLKRIDEKARAQKVSRSAYLARLAEKDLGAERRSPRLETLAAVEKLRRLVESRPSPGDTTELIREQRDSA